jgi:hypothetical protein
MKKNIFCRLLLGVLMMISLLLTACNSGSTSNSQLTQVDSVAAKSGFALNSANSVLMSLNWTIDGQALSDMSNLKDFGWHVLTLSVASIPSGESVPVQGIQWDIQGATAANTPGTEGSQVVIQDLNCQNAVFRNAGDSCSVYFRFNYNYAQYNNVPLSLSVEFAPGNFSQISYYQTIQTTLTPLEPIADIRPISRLETNYWQASQLQQAPNDYQIIQVQNGSPLAAVSLKLF